MIRFYLKSVSVFILTLFISSCGTSKKVVSSKAKTNSTAAAVDNSVQNKIEHVVPTTAVEAKELTLPEKLQKAKDEGFIFSKNDEIVFLAKENIGIRYLTGGTNSKGMDCSGMVYTTFKNAEMTVPRSSKELANYGTTIKKNDAVPGDLIFFKTNGRAHINHVGIITEVTENDIKFVHASVHRGVIISSLSETYYTKAFAKINRVLD
jgi:cell wall-associated NlpC family hydrolase